MTSRECIHKYCRILFSNEFHFFDCLNCDRHLYGCYLGGSAFCRHPRVVLLGRRGSKFKVITGARCKVCKERVAAKWLVVDVVNKDLDVKVNCSHPNIFSERKVYGKGFYDSLYCRTCKHHVRMDLENSLYDDSHIRPKTEQQKLETKISESQSRLEAKPRTEVQP